MLLLTLVVSSCGENDEPVDSPETINDPVAALLLFPEENSECNEGLTLNDSQSIVTFKWDASEYTDSYEVNLQNLDTQTNSKIESNVNSVDITLDRGSAYKWYVVSKSDKSTEFAQSESWKFYNAAPGVVNYAPFPADAINPVNGSTFDYSSEKVTLTWEASDLDNDIVEYEVLFGTINPPLTNSDKLIDSKFEMNITSNTTFYWMIKTTDLEKNSSESEIFSFTVN